METHQYLCGAALVVAALTSGPIGVGSQIRGHDQQSAGAALSTVSVSEADIGVAADLDGGDLVTDLGAGIGAVLSGDMILSVHDVISEMVDGSR